MELISRGALLLLAAASMLRVDGQTAPVCANSADCGPMGQCVDGQHGQHCSYLSTGTASETASRRFKYIVVGGGAAGCAAAATLAAHGATLLIERGDRKELYPSLRSMAVFDAVFAEGPFIEALTTSDGTRVARPRVLGGGTAVNVGIYNRDSADTAVGVFARLGYDTVKMEAAYNWTESILRPEPTLPPPDDSYAAGLRAAFLADDANMTNRSTPSISLAPGIFQPYTTLYLPSGRNRSSAEMLVRQANLDLTVLLNSAVTRVVFNPSKRAVGVEFRSQGTLYRVFVEDGDGEVVLAAGAMATPVLLMASGIGPSGHLSDHGIATIVDSPTVGTLTDPATVMFGMVGWRDEVLTPRTPAFLLTVPESGVAVEALTGEQAMRGLLLSSCAFVPRQQRTDAACEAAAQLIATRSNLNQDLSSVTAVGVKLLEPSSRGLVRLSSSSAEDRPIVTTGFFSVESDLASLAAGLRRVIRVVESNHMAPYRASRLPTMMVLLFGADSDANDRAGGTGQRPYLPASLPAASDNDTVLQDWCREYAVTMYHQSGTTAGAIDANFSIAGVAGLRVADASALTKLPGTNPMASVMALGRYAAQSIVSTPLGSSGTISPADFPVPSSSADDSDDALAIVGAVLGSVVAVLLVGVAVTKSCTSGKIAPSHPPRRLTMWRQMASTPSIDERAVWDKSKVDQIAAVNLAERTGRGSRIGILLKSAVALAGISVEPNSIMLRDVSAFIRDRKDKRQVNAVLRNIGAFIGAGKVTALVGPSGSGKSTLLNYLAFGKSFAHFEGSVKFGGKPLLDWRKSNRVGYVPQHSLFMPVLTALEHLTYQAALRLPHADQALREKEALRALSVVGLAKSKHIKCGGVLAGGFTIKGLSGGQQRLLSIATVLLENNPIMMLDEPTSGLDSHHAFSVMLCLRMLASMGHTVLLSIHQPSKEIWDMVDDTVVMACGRCVFSGPTPRLMPWFELHGFASLPDENPVDFVIDLVTTRIGKSQLLFGDNTLRSDDDVSSLALNFRHIHIASQLWAGLRDAVRSGRWRALQVLPFHHGDEDEREQSREKRAGWLRQVGVLCHRQCLLTIRNPGDALSRLLCYFGIGLLTGFVFAQVNDVQSWYGLLFWTANTIYLLPFATLTLYTLGKASFVADYGEDLTHVSATFVAISLIESGLNLCSGIAFILPVYYIAGMRGDLSCHVSATFLSTLVSSTTLRVIAMLSPSQDMAFVLGSGGISYQLLLAGFFVRFSEMSPLLSSLQWTSFFRYSVAYFATCEVREQTYDVSCVDDDQVAAMTRRFGGLGLVLQSVMPSSIAGEATLATFEYDVLSAEEYAAALLAIYVGLMAVLYLAHLRLVAKLIQEGNLAKQLPGQLREAIAAAVNETDSDAWAAWRKTSGGIYSTRRPVTSAPAPLSLDTTVRPETQVANAGQSDAADSRSVVTTV